ncbi:MAG: GAF domain-containing protein, partial [Eubacteriales bacterium]
AMKEIHYKRTIRSIERGIKNSTDLKMALSSALDNVVTAAKAEAGTFWFYERDKDGRIRPFAVYGGGDLGDFSLELGEGIAGKVIERGKEIIVEDCTSDPRWQGKADAKTGFVTKSMIVVPLKTTEYTFACIQIINKTSGDFYDAQDLLFVKELATFTAGMFESLGFIKQSAASANKSENTGVAFAELMARKDEVEMEILLRSIKEFADLGVKDQQLVIQGMRDIHGIFRRNRKRGR